MSRHRGDWDDRSRALGPMHHGPADPNAYRVARNNQYPGVGTGFPGPQYFNDGYSAAQGHDEYSKVTVVTDGNRDAYYSQRIPKERFMNGLPQIEKKYYKDNTAGLTPEDHRELKPLARQWADTEFDQSQLREQVYGHGPMMYGGRDSQTVHHGYIGNHYSNADIAEAFYADHDLYEDDPENKETDGYGRKVPAGYAPYTRRYPENKPPQGHYSTHVVVDGFDMKVAKPKKGRRH
ncbi:MAG: hypothetical protein Q9224_003560 [Gallowayella concinna]